MDTTKTITHLGLCAGYGGIELGLKRVLPTLRTVALCEIEAFACANLVAKMEAGLMDPAPIWTDLKTFPWDSFRDRVDILTGGYPCQPFSSAGKRLGAEDPRHLWPYIADGIRLLRPRVCFFENVEGHISLGLREVIGELEELGYTTTWGIFSASEVGASHQRKRVFILAHSDSERGQLSNWRQQSAKQVPISNGTAWRDVWPSRPGETQHAWEPPRVVADAKSSVSGIEAERQWRESAGGGSKKVMGNTEGQRPAALRAKHERLSGELRTASSSGKGVVGDTSNARRQGGGGANDPGWQVQRSTKPDGSGSNGEMESRQRQAQPSLGGDADGATGGLVYAELCVSCDNRTDELRLLGNGVVPATAERAFRTLLAQI